MRPVQATPGVPGAVSHRDIRDRTHLQCREQMPCFTGHSKNFANRKIALPDVSNDLANKYNALHDVT